MFVVSVRSNKKEIEMKRAVVAVLLAAALFVLAPQESLPGVVDASPSIAHDPGCSDALPYLNIAYTPEGNSGVCAAVKEEAPLQVLAGEKCPVGTIRQRIYKNEGDEAVCLLAPEQ